MFSEKDKEQITAKGISPDTIEYQLDKFVSGFPFSNLVCAATTEKGILHLSDEEKRDMVSIYNDQGKSLVITRFVPASGAATRMFKSLFASLSLLQGASAKEQEAMVKADPEIATFFNNLERYPFYEDLQLSGNEVYSEILEKVLSESGLSYGSLPKGLLQFHKYSKQGRTAFEEHLREAAGYCETDGIVNMHFTVSPEHLDSFKSLETTVIPALEKELSIEFRISYSFQKSETDTIAVDMQDQPFRDLDGKMVFRPGGHGALLENLNEIGGDIIFISNIDNVAPDRMKTARIDSKKYLGGVLLKARKQIYNYINNLRSTDSPSESLLKEVCDWMKSELYIEVPSRGNELDPQQKRNWILQQLDRPLRVCGMVKNEGEPGGGPFFVKDNNETETLQIVEPSQVDINDAAQLQLLKGSTHFNPVDLVCSIRNESGEKYNLMEYRDPETGFITMKSMAGKDLKAQELPGLWNGSMAYWTTIFVEVPSFTFTPVKTVFDLMRDEHLSQELLDS